MINEQLKLISNIPFQCWVQTFREGGHPNPEMRGGGGGEVRLKKNFLAQLGLKIRGVQGPSPGSTTSFKDCTCHEQKLI